MIPTKKRPVGITLLAIVFLYIGCFGTIFYPIIMLAGGAKLFEHLASGMIHSEFWLRIAINALLSVWYLFYVAYAVIGFGLWKLRKWAYQAILVLNEFFALICLLLLPFFLRPLALALAVVSGTALPFAWIVWYLKRPRVAFAFGAGPPARDAVGVEGFPPGLSGKGKALVAAVIAATLSLYFCSLLVAVESMLRSSEIYQMTLSEARNSSCVTRTLGTPLDPGWMTSGGTKESGTNGSANLSIPLSGPKGKGRLLVEAEKQNGIWQISSLVLWRGSEQLIILPTTSPPSCQ